MAQLVAVSLSPGSATPGATAALTVSMAVTGGAQPASLQWTMTYPADIVGVSAVGGPKTVNCSSTAGSTTCVMFDQTTNVIPSGSVATATFAISAGSLNTSDTVTVSGVMAADALGNAIPANGTGAAITIAQVQTVTPSSISCNPASLNAPGSASCSVTLSGAAPSGGLGVALSSNNANATVLASVTVAAGSTSGSFSATVGSITTNQSATIAASANGVSQTLSLGMIAPAQLSSLSCLPATLTSGQSASCTMTLNKAASSTASVAIASSSSVLATPASVTVASGASSGTFTATAGTVASSQTAALTATLNSLSVSTSVNLTVVVSPSGLSCNPASVSAPGSSTCTVTLSGAAPAGGLGVTVSSNNTNATVPGSVMVAAGASTGTFTATVASITTHQTATITASANGVSRTFSLSMIAPRWAISGTISPATLGGGATVYLSGAKSATATADASGNYSFSGLLNGAYTLTPSKSGVTFSPSKQSVSVNGANLTGINFNAAQTHKESKGAVVTSSQQPGAQTVTQGQAAAASLTMASPATGMAGKACSPGAIVTLTGDGFTLQEPQSAASYPLPTMLAGVQVRVNGNAMPLLFASTSQINFQCPLLPQGSSLDVVVVPESGVPEASVQSTMAAAAPDLFTLNGTSQGIILVASTNEIAMPKTAGTAGSPAQPGDVLTIYASGLGEAQQPVSPGTPAPSTPPVSLKNKIAVFVGGVEINPVLSVLAPGTVGLDQVNVQLPTAVAVGVGTGAAVPLYLQVTLADGTVVQSNTVTLAIDPVAR